MQPASAMDWDDLRIAAAVARAGTFSGAAAELGLDATTVARRIARLEAALAFPLFRAADGRRRPTAQGAEILAHVEAMSAHAAAIRAVQPAGEGVAGHVRVSATANICDRVLAPHAAALLKAHPGLSLSILASDANASFSRYEADMAVRMARPQKGGFAIRRLAALPLVLWEPEAPSGDTIVCAYPESLDGTPEMAELARLGLADRARFRSNSVGAIRAVLASGGAAAVLPDPGGSEALPLRRTPLQGYREAWLLIQPHLRKDPAARCVAGWIADCFARIGVA